MSFKISLDHERKLVYYQHDGQIKLESVGEVWRQLLSLREFTELSYDLISDYRKGSFVFSAEDENFKVVDNFFFSIKDILKGKKEAVILDDPYSTAISLLFENKYEHSLGFTIEIFATQKAALDWIGM
jgi:hypothetical protein